MSQDNTFAVAIDGLKNADQKDLVRQIHSMFGSITQMNADQTIAAYQTLNLIEEMSPAGEAKTMARHFKKAAFDHMQHLVHKTRGLGASTRVDLAERFRKVSGQYVSTV